MDGAKILVGEANTAVAATLRKYLESVGCSVQVAATPDEAMARARNEPPDVFVAAVGGFDGEAACRQFKEAFPDRPAVLVYPPERSDPDPDAAAAGADGYLIGPLKRGNVLSCVKGMLRIRTLLSQIAALEKELEKRVGLAASAASDSAYDFEFLRKLLLMEVKRSRRYKYPVSFVLLAIDRFRATTAGMDARTAGRFIGQILAIVTRTVRDIDLAMLYAEDKFLVFLPHTGAPGALRVANRLREAIAGREDSPVATASVGVAVYEGRGSVNFGTLLKDASEAMRQAQVAGGNRVEVGGETPRDEQPPTEPPAGTSETDRDSF